MNMTPKQKAIELLSQMPEPFKTWALENLEKYPSKIERKPKSISDAIGLFWWHRTPQVAGFWGSVFGHYKIGTPLPELPIEYRYERLQKENEDLKRKVAEYENVIEKNFIKATLAIDIRDARIKELESQLSVNSAFVNDGIVSEPREIIAEFTTHSETMPLRPAIEYLKEFPEPWRTAALKAVEEMPLHPLMVVNSAKKALLIGFRWGARSAGDKWRFLYTAMRNGTEWPAAELFID